MYFDVSFLLSKDDFVLLWLMRVFLSRLKSVSRRLSVLRKRVELVFIFRYLNLQEHGHWRGSVLITEVVLVNVGGLSETFPVVVPTFVGTVVSAPLVILVFIEIFMCDLVVFLFDVPLVAVWFEEGVVDVVMSEEQLPVHMISVEVESANPDGQTDKADSVWGIYSETVSMDDID